MSAFEKLKDDIVNKKKELQLLQANVAALTKELETKQKDHATMILEKDHDKADFLADEIVSMQTRIAGTRSAIKQLSEIIANQELELSKLQKTEAKALAFKLENNCLEIEREMYLHLVAALELLPSLHKKKKEYQQAMKTYGEPNLRSKSDVVARVHDRVKVEALNLLNAFPKAIQETDPAKKPEEVNRLLRKMESQ